MGAALTLSMFGFASQVLKDLEKKKAGWDIDLTREGSLQSAMIEAIAMDDPSYSKFQQGARKIAEDYIEANDFLAQYKELFF